MTDKTSLLPVELAKGETLRDHLRAGRFAALLPLFAFLRELTRSDGWTPPPLRAAFILDDPNLHWPTYGYVPYADLARSAERQNYHAVMAMIPLDAWFAHPVAADLFAQHTSRLSLTVHGNSHRRRELEGAATFDKATRVVAQALRRIKAFERRTNLEVDRVMVPPHGACSPAALRALHALGFEAACVNRPYPWVARRGDSVFKHPAPWRPLTGIDCAEIVEGCPILLRQTFRVARDDLVLRAYLDQPLLVYGHHTDLASGLEVIEDEARYINRIGTVSWLRLRDISRSSFEHLRSGSRLSIRPYAYRLSVAVPKDVSELEVLIPESIAATQVSVASAAGNTTTVSAEGGRAHLAIRPEWGGLVLDVKLRPVASRDPHAMLRPRVNPWLFARRIAAEGRDRATPLLARTF